MSNCAISGSNGAYAGCRPGSSNRTFEPKPEVRNFKLGEFGFISQNGREKQNINEETPKPFGERIEVKPETIMRKPESGGCMPHGDGEVEITHHVVEGRVMEIPVLKTSRNSEGVVFHGDAPVGY